MIAAFASIVVMGIFFKKIFHANSFYVPIIIGGIALFSVYPGIVKHLPNLVSKIGGIDVSTNILAILLIVGLILFSNFLK